jgi:hypothetical protein
MKREKFQADTTRDIRELARQVAKRRGQTFTAFLHRALAKEDPELAELIEKQLGIVSDHAER